MLTTQIRHTVQTPRPNNIKPTFYLATITKKGEELNIIVFQNQYGIYIEFITEIEVGSTTQYHNNNRFGFEQLFNKRQPIQYQNSNFKIERPATEEEIKNYCAQHPNKEQYKNELTEFMDEKVQTKQEASSGNCLCLKRKQYKC